MVKIRIVKGHNPMTQQNIIRSTEEKGESEKESEQ